MKRLFYYAGIFLLILYILSPIDAHPLFMDDLIVSGLLFYLLYMNTRKKKSGGYANSYTQSQDAERESPGAHLTIDDAYRLLGVNRDTPWEEVKKAYKEKISMSHPDKVSHLDRELQEKAAEVTLKVNSAMEMIRKERG